MIEICAEGKDVVIHIAGKYPIHETTFTFRANASSDYYAKLVADNLKTHLIETLEKIRRNTAHEAHRRAKAKERKLSAFYGTLNPEDIGF